MLKSKKLLSVVLIISVMLVLSVSGFALAGGIPAAHGASGEEFGETVSALAQDDPQALVDHVASKPDTPNDDLELNEAEESDIAGGMPAAHDMSGKAFGAAVSALAQDAPQALVEHVAGKPDRPNGEMEAAEADKPDAAGGMPAAHGVSGKEFGEAVSALAQDDPQALVAHVASKPDTPDGELDVNETEESDIAGGMPAAHDASGEAFGEAVSALAQDGPQALVDHVRSR